MPEEKEEQFDSCPNCGVELFAEDFEAGECPDCHIKLTEEEE